MGDSLAALPVTVVYYLGIHKSLHQVLTHSASFDVFASHVFEDIQSARESRQVLHTLSQQWINCIEVHTIDVDKRECIATIGLKSIQDIATLQVDVDDTFLMLAIHKAGKSPAITLLNSFESFNCPVIGRLF